MILPAFICVGLFVGLTTLREDVKEPLVLEQGEYPEQYTNKNITGERQ